jgi:flagella basal body P-ring formation protein FlgA
MPRMTKKIGKVSLSLIAASMLAALPQSFAEAAELREKLIVTEAVVKLADIFTDTGINGEEVVMEAPVPGKKRQISSYELARLAEKYDLDWQRPAYLKRVYIHRDGDSFSLNELKPAIVDKARIDGIEDDVEVRIYGRKTGLYLPSGYGVDDIEFQSFILNDRKDRFSAEILIPTGTSDNNVIRISGTIDAVRLIPMLNRIIAPGEVISEHDISWRKVPAKRIGHNTIVTSRHLIGQTVRRALPASKVIRANDIAAPIAIEKGSMVQMNYQSGRLLLSMQGRALEDGGIGDTIRLMNPKSKKTVFAKVHSKGFVTVARANHVKLAAN